MNYDYRISVIIPVHNSEKYIGESFSSLLKQTMPQKDFEVLLVNNGSTDRSEEICLDFSKEHPNFKAFTIAEKGVSFARNAGIRAAKGKYLLYLDADDTLTPNTLLSVANFFDKHYNETDLVTYKIVPYKNGRRQKLHLRYNILQKTGIYNLEEDENCFAVQNTINVCVKNLGEDNILFDTDLIIHEDQHYDLRIMAEKKTLGFVNGPEYRYIRHNDSATGSRQNAFYIFEKTTAMWEEIFRPFSDTAAPRYLQALLLHDINWKNACGILLPYHYGEADYANALNRIKQLISYISADVIQLHPTATRSFKLFLLKVKYGAERFSLQYNDTIRVLLDGQPVYDAKRITFTVHRLKLIDSRLNMDFSVKQIAFFFLNEPIQLYLVQNGKRIALDYHVDDYNYFPKCGVTAPYLSGRILIDCSADCDFHFEAEFGGQTFRADCEFQVNAPLKNGKRVNGFFADRKYLSYNKNTYDFRCKEYSRVGKISREIALTGSNLFYFGKQNFRVPVLRFFFAFKPRRGIWFYQDIAGVFDNAYLQFLHDIGIQDGVTRYYIIHREDLERRTELFPGIPEENFIIFGSRKHKLYYFSAKKIITGYSNLGNFCPYDAYPYRWYADLTRFELIYLQHGILHASLEKMYAHKNCQIDRVVVSTTFEQKNFTSDKYGYRADELISSCMPRYDRINPGHQKETTRILFAPSWRANLVGKLVIDKREAFDDLFVKSDFYTETMKLLNHPMLDELLEKYNLEIDIKLHPNFSCYNKFFELDNPRIHLMQDNFRIDDYAAMITDYSSMVFDAVYLNCPVLYFVPDYDQFKCGISSAYRELDLPLEEGFGPLAETGEQLVENLKIYAENGFTPPAPYAARMDHLFLYKDNNACDRLYRALSNK